MEIGIIDFGGIDENSNGIETIHNTISNAQLAEEFGFSRYWLTEHYLDGIAWRNPEIVINLIAGYTNVIKVGAAGVIVDLNSPFRIAQDYTLLANLFPDRIDLGFTKGGASGDMREELIKDIKPQPFFEGIKKIKSFLDNKNEHLVVTPPNAYQPEMWILGTSASSINFAVENKMNFSLSLFHIINGELPAPSIIHDFKKKFFDQNGYNPNVNIAISMFCSDNSNKILHERATRKNVRLNVSGFPEECLLEIERIKKEYDIEEIIVLNLGQNARDKSLAMETLKTKVKVKV